jgi:hypothetical protein
MKAKPIPFKRFPNAVQCIHCKNAFSVKWLNDFSVSNSVFSNDKLLTTNVTTESSAYLKVGLSMGYNHHNAICKFHVKKPIISSNDFCKLGNYIVDLLESKTKFIAFNDGKFINPSTETNGFISSGIPSMYQRCLAGCLFQVEKSLLTAFYCDFDSIRGLEMNFAAWWEPFSVYLWLSLFITVVVVVGTVALLVNLKSQCVNGLKVKICFKGLSSELIKILRLILRQDDSEDRILLLLFCFSMFLITCLYENVITSLLVVPYVPIVQKTIADLHEIGFKFRSVFPFDYLKHPIQDYLRTIGREELFSQLAFVITDDEERYDEKEPANGSLRHAFIGEKRLDHWEYETKLFRVFFSLKCQPVKDPISETHAFIIVKSFLSHEHLLLLKQLRDHGFIAWWTSMEKFSNDLMFHIIGKNRKTTPSSSSFISNLNLVPVYAAWLCLLVFSSLCFIVEVWEIKVNSIRKFVKDMMLVLSRFWQQMIILIRIIIKLWLIDIMSLLSTLYTNR